MSTARVPDRHIAHLDNQVSFPISALGKQWLRGLKTFQLNRQAFKSSLASQSSTNHRYSGKEQPGEYSQLRRGGHLLEANARQRISLHVCQARRSDRRDRRASQQVACLLCAAPTPSIKPFHDTITAIIDDQSTFVMDLKL